MCYLTACMYFCLLFHSLLEGLPCLHFWCYKAQFPAAVYTFWPLKLSQCHCCSSVYHFYYFWCLMLSDMLQYTATDRCHYINDMLQFTATDLVSNRAACFSDYLPLQYCQPILITSGTDSYHSVLNG